MLHDPTVIDDPEYWASIDNDPQASAGPPVSALAAFDRAVQRHHEDDAEPVAVGVLDRDHDGPMAGVDGYRYTDHGNAQRLLARQGDRLRYVPLWHAWLAYDGRRWRIDHADTVAAHLAAQIGQELIRHVPKVYGENSKLNPLLAAVRRAESAAGVAATLSLASSVPGVAIDHEALDADPWRLNVRNGTVDLRTGERAPHDPADLLTLCAEADHDPSATAVEWDRFVERILPDLEVRLFVRRLAGLALIGVQLEHMLVICLGRGANGKSTITRVLADVLGSYAVTTSRDVLLALKHDAHPTARADLFRRRFAHSGEIPPGARLDEAQVKELTGGDRIKARRMREDFWEFDPSHLLWLHANHRPSIEGTDDGIWRRVVLIPFDEQIPVAERDPHLARRIVDNEASGVLNWALDGLADYHANGLQIPDRVAAATGEYRNASDTVARFMVESGLTFEPSATIGANDLLAMHGDWFSAAGITEPEKAHYQRVIEALKAGGARSTRLGKDRRRGWTGIGETS